MIYFLAFTFNLCLKILWPKLQNVLLFQERQLLMSTFCEFKLNSMEYGTGEIIYNLFSCTLFLLAGKNVQLHSHNVLMYSSNSCHPLGQGGWEGGKPCLLSSKVPGKMNKVNEPTVSPTALLNQYTDKQCAAKVYGQCRYMIHLQTCNLKNVRNSCWCL